MHRTEPQTKYFIFTSFKYFIFTSFLIKRISITKILLLASVCCSQQNSKLALTPDNESNNFQFIDQQNQTLFPPLHFLSSKGVDK